LRLAAHIMVIALLLAWIIVVSLARGKGPNWRYWRLGQAVLIVWFFWFTGLALSTKGPTLIARDQLVWVLGILEISGALGGWAWWILTVRATFCLEKPKSTRLPPMTGRFASGD
jgi:hypothetical protein